MSKLLLCDGHNLAFRAFYGIRELSRSDGMPTNMIHGWLKTFWRLEDELAPDSIYVFFDKGGCPRRQAILPSYKANRGAPPEGFSEQLEWVKKLTLAIGYQCFEESGAEADDLIASALSQSRQLFDQILIVSSDKDLAQLVSDGVSQLLPPPTANPRIGWRHLDQNGVKEKFGVSPTKILDYLAIIGDQSDNIPGINGVGPKTAVKWLSEFGNLDDVILNAGRLSPKSFCSLVYENRDLLKRNQDLIRLDDKIHLEFGTSKVQWEELERILNDLEMVKSLEEAKSRYVA